MNKFLHCQQDIQNAIGRIDAVNPLSTNQICIHIEVDGISDDPRKHLDELSEIVDDHGYGLSFVQTDSTGIEATISIID